MSRKPFYLTILVILLSACAPQIAAAPAVVSDLPAATQAPPDVSVVSIQSGEGVIAAIERDCSCIIANFADLGVVVEGADGIMYFMNVNALKWSGIAALPFSQAGDTVTYGAVNEVARYASGLHVDNVVTVSSDTDWAPATETLTHTLHLYGWMYDRDITFLQINTGNTIGDWSIQGCEKVDFSVFAAAMGTTVNSSAAWDQLCK